MPGATSEVPSVDTILVDPTIPAPETNVAEYGFEGRFEDWADDARYFEYSKAANPIGSGLTSKVPLADFPRHLHEEGPTRIVPFDLSEQLRCPGPATSPALCPGSVRRSRHQDRRRAQPRLAGQLPAHPSRRADRYQPQRDFAAVLRHPWPRLLSGQRPNGQVGEG